MSDAPKLIGNREFQTAYALIRDTSGSTEIVGVIGELDLSIAAELETLLERLGDSGNSVVLDLSACRYFDSTIISVMIRATKRFGKRFAIVVPPDHRAQRIFRIAGLASVLPLEPTIVAAKRRSRFSAGPEIGESAAVGD